MLPSPRGPRLAVSFLCSHNVFISLTQLSNTSSTAHSAPLLYRQKRIWSRLKVRSATPKRMLGKKETLLESSLRKHLQVSLPSEMELWQQDYLRLINQISSQFHSLLPFKLETFENQTDRQPDRETGLLNKGI